MTFEEFQNQTMEAVKNAFPDLSVEKQEVTKLQGQSYTGMAVKPEGSNIAATVNLKLFYDNVERGDMSLTAALRNIIDNISEITHNMPKIDIGMLMDYQQMKDKLTLHMIPIAGNEQKLAEIPHKTVEDMAVVYRFELESNEKGSSSILVTDVIMKNFGLTPEQLHADALEAAPITHPASLRNMNDVMRGMIGDAADMLMPDEPSPMWVATVGGGHNGACAIQYPGFLEQAAEMLRGDFFVLPSSVHEVLFVKDDGSLELSNLEDMVRNINETEVRPEDRLSDSVFHYDSEDHVFENARSFIEREEQKEQMLADAPAPDMVHEDGEEYGKMNVLLVEPGKYPREVTVGTELEDLQEAVGGYIEVTYPFEEEVGLIVNEEGKINGLPLNRAVRDENGEIMDVIAGSFLVVGLTEESFGSLTPDQMKRYEQEFHQPEAFVRMGRGLMAIPVPEEITEKDVRKVVDKALSDKPKHKKPEHDGH